MASGLIRNQMPERVAGSSPVPSALFLVRTYGTICPSNSDGGYRLGLNRDRGGD